VRAAEKTARGGTGVCRLLWFAGALAAGVGSWVGLAEAARQQWVPSLSVRGEFDDNVEFAAAGADADLSAWVSPGLAWRQTTERWWWEGGVELDVVRYRERTDLNRVDQLYQASGALDWTERLQVQANASYRQGSTLESQVEDTGRVSRRSPLYQFGGGLGGTYGLSPRTQVGLAYQYFASTYAGGGNVDFDAHDLVLLWQRTLANERDQVRVQPAYRAQRSAVADVDDLSLMLGWRHPVTEIWVLDLAGGGRYTYQDTRGDTERRWNGILELASIWEGETTTVNVGINLDRTYGAAGRPLERQRAHGAWRRNLTERWWLRLGADLARTRDLGVSGSDQRYGSVTPSVGYALGLSQTVAATYHYAYRAEEALAGDEVATRNRVWVQWQGRF